MRLTLIEKDVHLLQLGFEKLRLFYIRKNILLADLLAFLKVLADQPQIPVPLIRALVESHAQGLKPITGPLIDGQRGNPVLFDRITFDDLLSLSGEVGGRKLFSKYSVNWISWLDPAALFDVDTPEDYVNLLESTQ